ncbi:MAG: hypothetical protein KY459_16465 [Acidobacteria bacterium]|nr:hypothetical protein [Acidobacteriota bacterium]
MNDLWSQHTKYLLRRKVLKLFGGAFHIYDGSGNLVLYSEMKAFKLKEDIRLYASEQMQSELLTISARTWADISTIYDVVDGQTRERVGCIQRKGLRSILRDEWIIMDPAEKPVAVIREDSALLAIVRRAGGSLIPQKYHMTMNGAEVATMTQRFNPFVYKLDVDFSPDTMRRLDRRLGIAAAILLAAIEGRQD